MSDEYTIFDAHLQLSALLLQGPRAPKERPAFGEASRKILGTERPPVSGVAIRLKDGPGLVVFLRHEWALPPLEALGFKIETVVSGRMLPAARPTAGGDSLSEGHTNAATGTFGCAVCDAGGASFLLSCAHIIAGVNTGVRGSTIVWQPGARDRNPARIGVLRDYCGIALGGFVPNQIDGAIAEPDDQSAVASGIRDPSGTAPVRGTNHPLFGTRVHKTGWSTSRTTGTIHYFGSFIQEYEGVGEALFSNQIGIVGETQNFAARGDSGSVVLDDVNRAVGLVFSVAEGIDLTWANPIAPVLSHFGVQVAR